MLIQYVFEDFIYIIIFLYVMVNCHCCFKHTGYEFEIGQSLPITAVRVECEAYEESRIWPQHDFAL